MLRCSEVLTSTHILIRADTASNKTPLRMMSLCYFVLTLGLSFKSTVCQAKRYPYAAAVIESYGDKVELLIAHEIAHG